MRESTTTARVLALALTAGSFHLPAATRDTFAATPSGAGLPTKKSEIHVTLFGQPCLLGGPFAESILRTVHELSPERIPPFVTAEQANQARDRLSKASELPQALEGYRDRLTQRLQAQARFHEGLAEARKIGKADALVARVRPSIDSARVAAFEATARKAEARQPPSSWSAATVDELNEAFEVAIEPHPEEEFHRVIHRLGISYQCSFEAETEADEGN